MKYKGFDGRIYNIKYEDYLVYADAEETKSKYHIAARELIHDYFKSHVILEEVRLPGSKNRCGELIADFFIPSMRIIIEVHGQQHYEYNSFFFNSKADFLMAQRRDRLKQEWCELNEITYIEFDYKESVDVWRAKIELVCRR